MTQAAHFRVDPRLASLLGESYRSTEQAIKELIDNAWDADAGAPCTNYTSLLVVGQSLDPFER